MINKPVIHEFDPIIYPRKLWIMITDNPKDIEEYFEDEKGRKLDYESFKNRRASTMSAIRKDTDDFGVLIVFHKEEYLTISTIAHESFHVADWFCDILGLDCEREKSNEHIAYLIGWVAQCCEKVKGIKFKYK